MIWRSPVTGEPLRPAGAWAVADETGRWPLVDGIPFLRTGRDALRAEALAALDDGDVRAARGLLLTDQDDWAPTPPPAPEAAASVADEPLSLRAAMARLALGPVADYLAYRWSDPTFLSGLALLGAHAPAGARIFELACGHGAFLRALAPDGRGTIGGDVVWAKLWLARRYVAPAAELACFDAAGPFPLPDGAADVAFCHDALYFLPDKAHALAELRRIAPTVLAGHVHNALADNHSAGAPLAPAEYAALLPGATLYADDELTAALLADRAPAPAEPGALSGAAAIALALVSAPPAAVPRALALPPEGVPLRLNPLYGEPAPDADPVRLDVRWPSPRYAAEYGPLSGHLDRTPAIARATLARAAAGEREPAIDALARRRVLLDLPERW